MLPFPTTIDNWMKGARGVIDTFKEGNDILVYRNDLWLHPSEPYEIEDGSGHIMMIWFKDTKPGNSTKIPVTKELKHSKLKLAKNQFRGRKGPKGTKPGIGHVLVKFVLVDVEKGNRPYVTPRRGEP
jgi:hypothetical protein